MIDGSVDVSARFLQVRTLLGPAVDGLEQHSTLGLEFAA